MLDPNTASELRRLHMVVRLELRGKMRLFGRSHFRALVKAASVVLGDVYIPRKKQEAFKAITDLFIERGVIHPLQAKDYV